MSILQNNSSGLVLEASHEFLARFTVETWFNESTVFQCYSLTFIFILFILVCVLMCKQVYVCTHTRKNQRTTLGIILVRDVYLLWDRVFQWPGSSLVGKAARPVSPRKPPASAFQDYKCLQPGIQFLCEFWWSNSGLVACKASISLTELSP